MSIPLDIPGYSASLAQSTDGLATGQSLGLTAYANVDVGPTPYWLEIYDSTTGTLIASCGSGTSCSTNESQSGPTTHNFIAYIGSYSSTNPPGTIAATSNTVTCTWFSLSLSANPYYLGAGQTSTVTASVQPDVGPTPYWLGVYDSSTGGSVAVCGNGTSCGGGVNIGSGTRHSFVAYVAGYGTTNPPPNVHVTSNTIYVTWYTVSLSALPDRLAPGGTTTLTATASYDVGPSPFYISIFDYTTNIRVGSPCPSGNVCSTNVAQSGSTVRDYIAYVGNNSPTLPPSPVANSNLARVTWISISLNACDAATSAPCPANGGRPFFLAPGTSATLTATATLDVGPTSYMIQIYDQTAQSFVGQCASGTTCNMNVTQSVPTIHYFAAYVTLCCATTYPPSGPRATSNSVKVTWLKVDLNTCFGSVSICGQPSNANGAVAGNPITLSAIANDDIGQSPYSLLIFDQTTQAYFPACSTGSSCTVQYSAPAAGTHTFQAYIGNASTPSQTVAVSSPVSVYWVLWGVDSWNPLTQAFIDSVTSSLGRPDFWGRYIGVTSGLPNMIASEATLAHNNGIKIWPIYSEFAQGSTSGYSTGVSYANTAASAAGSLGIPAGTMLTIDIEPSSYIDSAFIQGWYDGIVAKNYVAAIYENPYTGTNRYFQGAYCSAVASKPAIGTNMLLWSQQPSGARQARANAPQFGPAAPGCANQTVGWQYNISSGSNPNVDLDELPVNVPLW